MDFDGALVPGASPPFLECLECHYASPAAVHLALGCAHSLTVLDFFGCQHLGDFLDPLLSQEITFPRLQVMRLGSGMDGTTSSFDMGLLVEVLPSLQALDLSYLAVKSFSGIDIPDVLCLCTALQIVHLDLSMAMKWMDLDSVVLILSRCAPALRSLAVHGLTVHDDPLLKFSRGCSQLERIHLVHCHGFSWQGLTAGLLSETSRLQDLDISLTEPLGYCGAAEIQQILGQRKYPLHSLRIIGVVGLPFDVVAAALAAASAASHCTTEVWASTDDNHVVYLRPVDGAMVPSWTERPFRTLDWGNLDRPVPRLFDSLMINFSQPRNAESRSR